VSGVVEVHVADPCGSCRRLRQGRADLARRVLRVTLPPGCRGEAACRRAVGALVRDETARYGGAPAEVAAE
jgi:hypothetical protein